MQTAPARRQYAAAPSIRSRLKAAVTGEMHDRRSCNAARASVIPPVTIRDSPSIADQAPKIGSLGPSGVTIYVVYFGGVPSPCVGVSSVALAMK
ncbi:MAG: hypothetical protein PWP08_1024 [Methanofollis sp.]|nr:hypothetical protein [Methanofollis sp.]